MKKTLLVLGVVTLILGVHTASYGELDWRNGSWDLESSALFGVHSGSTDRSGDYFITTAVSYEMVMTDHVTLSARLLPFFYYEQDALLPQWPEEEIYGAGFGLRLRWYFEQGTQQGWFVEGNGNALFHHNQIAGNTGNFNFLTGAGVGYVFNNGWHVMAKYEHISNAGLSDRNSGANGAGFGIGYRF